MKLRRAIGATLRSKRFWLWEVGGAILYGIPVAIRFITKSVYIPILSLPGFWISHYIPGNLVEKILINAFFPGGAGGVAGETLVSNYKGEAIRGKTKYLARLDGALVQTSAWSAVQYWGYFLWISGPHGSGNLFEHPVVFPINFTLATLSIFTPDVVNFAKSKLENAYQKLSKRKNHPAKKT
ncbi:MAG TPA: hypothetical protein VMW84_01860 [Acidobacteriota bacterium]|nr:hypothetical protein [Acidobacteriota bacterium]